MALVYIAENMDNGTAYVGFTSRTLEQRIREHRYASRRPSRRHYLHRAMHTYGAETFRFVAIAEGPESEMLTLERELIAELGTAAPGGYNLTEGGDQAQYSEESRQRMSELATARASREDRRAQLTAASRLRWSQPGARERHVQTLRSRSDDVHRRQAESMRRRWQDPEYRRKVMQSRGRVRRS